MTTSRTYSNAHFAVIITNGVHKVISSSREERTTVETQRFFHDDPRWGTIRERLKSKLEEERDSVNWTPPTAREKLISDLWAQPILKEELGDDWKGNEGSVTAQITQIFFDPEMNSLTSALVQSDKAVGDELDAVK